MNRQSPSPQIGGLHDPVAQSIRNEQNQAAAPSQAEIAAEKQRDQDIATKLSELASNGVFLKDRDAVQTEAEKRDWPTVATKAESAPDQQWRYLIKLTLEQADE